MSAVSEFRELVRWWLQDDPDSPDYTDDMVDRAIRQVIRCGLVPGYALDATLLNITPDVTRANDYMLLGVQAAWSFVRVEPEFTSNRTRAYAETTRKSQALQAELQDLVHRLTNGSMFFSGWQSVHSWLVGSAGLGGRDVGYLLTKLTVAVPIGEVTITSDGII